MDLPQRLSLIARGRTDLVVGLTREQDWKQCLEKDRVRPMQWLVYYGDVTAMRFLMEQGADLSSIDLNIELGNAAFFGHWKMCDFLIENGADVNAPVDLQTGERPLHNALSKAGRPYYRYVVRLLLERGADPNAATIPGQETGAFMRDVRTTGETPLHRAAAYADAETIDLMVEFGADRSRRDANGDSPLTWASRHLRPGRVLTRLAFGEHAIGPAHEQRNVSDHGQGWGNGMEWNLVGDYIPFSHNEQRE